VSIRIKNRNPFLKSFLVLASLTSISLVVIMTLSSINPVEGHQGDDTMKQKSIEEVLKEHAGELMSIPGVVGVYIGELTDGRPCIKVMVVKETPELESKIPSMLEGYPVVIVESGEIRPLSSPMD
jgi:hypothetical protein